MSDQTREPQRAETDEFERAVATACAAFKVSSGFAPVLAEACRVFGINPDPDHRPRELLAARGYGDADQFEPLSVVIVTGGGLKLRYPFEGDQQTEHTLRFGVFGAFKRDKRTGTITELPLPRDLRLPAHHRTGIPPVLTGR